MAAGNLHLLFYLNIYYFIESFGNLNSVRTEVVGIEISNDLVMRIGVNQQIFLSSLIRGNKDI